jgi:subtilisin family serine protease
MGRNKGRSLVLVIAAISLVVGGLVWVKLPHVAGKAGASGIFSSPNTNGLALSWGLERIEAPQAWQRTTGSAEVVVAVIDSGIDVTAPQLSGKVWTNPDEVPGNGIDDDGNGYIDDVHGWDFRDGDACSLAGSKIHWHGTFVAGIIVAQASQDGVAGVAPGVRIMDIRFLDSKNLFYSSDWTKFAQAIDYAVANGARIINLSIYSNGKPPLAFEQAIKRAIERGVIVVGIAGNDGKDAVSYPAKYPGVLAVSAIDQGDRLAQFSNCGPEVAVAAPGEKVTSLFPGGKAGTASGTSFSAPHVSGTLALVLSANPHLTTGEAVSLLKRTAVDLGQRGGDPQFGAGLINAGQAVTTAQPGS